MPASAGDREIWRKRKRGEGSHKAKLKDTENDDTFDDEDYDPNLDQSQNQETEDGQHYHRSNLINQISQQNEKLVDGGSRICDFPVAVKRIVNRPHPSVFRIVEAERAGRNGDQKVLGQSGVAMLENISYGQLQALSTVPRDSPALLSSSEETVSGSYVITQPRIIAGRGVTKRLGSAARVHIVPAHSEWFSLSSVHRLERQVVPHYFSEKSPQHTPEKYMENRNFIVAKYMENPEKHLSVADCQEIVSGVDVDDLTRIIQFLDHWGIINYCATSFKPECQKYGTYLCEDSNGELDVPSAALKSVDSLIQFDEPKCRLKAADVYPELAFHHDKDPDLDSTIREQLSEHECSYCSCSIAVVYYQSQKEEDVMLCLDCFNEGRFVTSHSSLDFVKVRSGKNHADVDGDSWSDQETLSLFQGIQLYNDNWNKIADHVGSKSKAQCILHFVRLPLNSSSLEKINLLSTSGSSTLWNHDDHERSESNSNGFSLHNSDSETELPFSDSENPVMKLIAFVTSSMGPRVAAACANACLLSLSDSVKERNGSTTNSSTESIPLSPDAVRVAAEVGLAAAALKAKLFADYEEREIQRVSANIINNQLKRLELKLKQFAEVETMLMKECEQMERTRLRFASERALAKSSPQQQFVSLGPRPVGPTPGAGPSNLMNGPMGNIRQQHHFTGGPQQQPFFPGFGNNNNHPQMSGVPHQQGGMPHQQGGMYGPGPRLSLSGLNPSSSSAPNAMFGAPSNSQPSPFGYSMVRPMSGRQSGLG